MNNKIVKYLMDKDYRFLINASRGLYDNLSDEEFLCRMYKAKIGKNLNLKDPVSYNEKLQWLKLNDRNPIYTTIADKYEVKRIVSEAIGEQYIIPTLGVWDSFDEIDFNRLPDKTVLKCTHDSGGVVLMKEVNRASIDEARKKINKCLGKNYYYAKREWPYKNIKPRIIAEPLLDSMNDEGVLDYKFFCFDGVVKLMFVASDRACLDKETKFDFFDRDYNHLNIINVHPNAEKIPDKPRNYELMIELAEKLSHGLRHVRVDFYEVGGLVKFGEMTLYHFGGFGTFEPEEWDYRIGQWLKL